MSTDNTRGDKTTVNSGTRMGVHTTVDNNVATNVQHNKGGDTRQTKNTQVRGGDAKGGSASVNQQGGRLIGGAQHTAINLPPPPPPQSTIIFPPTYHQPTQRPQWIESPVFGVYWAPSVIMSITLSITCTLGFLILWYLCRESMSSKAEAARKKFVKGANKTADRLATKGTTNSAVEGFAKNLEAATQKWGDKPNTKGQSTHDLGAAFQALNDLVERTSLIEQSHLNQEKLMGEMRDEMRETVNKVAQLPTAVGHVGPQLHVNGDGSAAVRLQQQHLQQQQTTHQGPQPAAATADGGLTPTQLRQMFQTWMQNWNSTSKNCSAETEKETPRDPAAESSRRRRRTGDTSDNTHSGQSPTAPMNSSEPAEQRVGSNTGAVSKLYPREMLQEAFASFLSSQEGAPGTGTVGGTVRGAVGGATAEGHENQDKYDCSYKLNRRDY